MDWYLRVLIGVLTGEEVTEQGFPMPWERALRPKRKPLTREERREQIRASREGMAEAIQHASRVAGVT